MEWEALTCSEGDRSRSAKRKSRPLSFFADACCRIRHSDPQSSTTPPDGRLALFPLFVGTDASPPTRKDTAKILLNFTLSRVFSVHSVLRRCLRDRSV